METVNTKFYNLHNCIYFSVIAVRRRRTTVEPTEPGVEATKPPGTPAKKWKRLMTKGRRNGMGKGKHM